MKGPLIPAKKHRKHPFTALSAAAACMLSSCYVWNIGKNIEDRFVTITGVDVDNPADGKIYRVKDGSRDRYYMQAPEITYRPSHYTVSFNSFSDTTDGERYLYQHPAGIRRTGRQRWVEVVPCSDGWGYGRDVEELPAGATVYLCDVKNGQRGCRAQYDGLTFPEEAALREKQIGTLGAICAAPFSYVVDPLLTITTNIAAYATVLPIIYQDSKKR